MGSRTTNPPPPHLLKCLRAFGKCSCMFIIHNHLCLHKLIYENFFKKLSKKYIKAGISFFLDYLFVLTQNHGIGSLNSLHQNFPKFLPSIKVNNDEFYELLNQTIDNGILSNLLQ